AGERPIGAQLELEAEQAAALTGRLVESQPATPDPRRTRALVGLRGVARRSGAGVPGADASAPEESPEVAELKGEGEGRQGDCREHYQPTRPGRPQQQGSDYDQSHRDPAAAETGQDQGGADGQETGCG